jgi:hypothetical protein
MPHCRNHENHDREKREQARKPILNRTKPKEYIMPIKFEDEDEDNMLTIQVSGKLTKADYVYFAPEFERLIQLNGKMRVLFNLAGFDGWEAGALWEDIKFDVKHFADIERLALVGDNKWQHRMAMFCKPFTKATIRYFDRADAAKARVWLKEA